MQYFKHMTKMRNDINMNKNCNWKNPLKEKPPNYYIPLLLYVECDYGSGIIRYMIQGYYHTYNVWCDFSGDTICGDQKVLAWCLRPECPKIIKNQEVTK